MSQYLSVQEAADQLKCSHMTIRRMLETGELAPVKIGSRTFVEAWAIEAITRGRTVDNTTAARLSRATGGEVSVGMWAHILKTADEINDDDNTSLEDGEANTAFILKVDEVLAYQTSRAGKYVTDTGEPDPMVKALAETLFAWTPKCVCDKIRADVKKLRR